MRIENQTPLSLSSFVFFEINHHKERFLVNLRHIYSFFLPFTCNLTSQYRPSCSWSCCQFLSSPPHSRYSIDSFDLCISHCFDFPLIDFFLLISTFFGMMKGKLLVSLNLLFIFYSSSFALWDIYLAFFN